MANTKDLLLLFERPNEPIFLQRGKGLAVFDVPESFLVDHYSKFSAEIKKSYTDTAGSRISVKDFDNKPDISVSMQLGRREKFSIFLPKHQMAAQKLIDVFMAANSIDDLMSSASFARDRVNSQLFNYALSVAMIHRKETRDMKLPHFPSLFPDEFMDPMVLNQVREESTVLAEGSRRPVTIP